MNPQIIGSMLAAYMIVAAVLLVTLGDRLDAGPRIVWLCLEIWCCNIRLAWLYAKQFIRDAWLCWKYSMTRAELAEARNMDVTEFFPPMPDMTGWTEEEVTTYKAEDARQRIRFAWRKR
jgi:hypothetical protein